jgi:hypothetical protein
MSQLGFAEIDFAGVIAWEKFSLAAKILRGPALIPCKLSDRFKDADSAILRRHREARGHPDHISDSRNVQYLSILDERRKPSSMVASRLFGFAALVDFLEPRKDSRFQ